MVYMAISEMESGKTEQAIENLLYVNNLNEATLQDEAGWYLAMAYLKDNQKEKARHQLQDIAEQRQHPFRDRASKLLKSIK
jgi:FimV-like protein